MDMDKIWYGRYATDVYPKSDLIPKNRKRQHGGRANLEHEIYTSATYSDVR